MFSTETLTDPKVIQLLKSGGVGVIPTDTVYGLVCRAADEVAVKQLFTIKKREGSPGTIIAASVDQLAGLGLKKRYLTADQEFWPGAISVIVPCGEELHYLHMGLNSLAVRVPGNEELQALLRSTGPLMTTSANHPKEPVATNIEEAKQYFGERVNFYVDGGNMDSRPPSTIIRIVDDAIEIIREGAVKINENGRIEK
jgi:L-threonylcarbamoyladenylate synthase